MTDREETMNEKTDRNLEETEEREEREDKVISCFRPLG